MRSVGAGNHEGDCSAHSSFAAVFREFEPFGQPFAPSVERKLLMFETDPFGLDDEQVLALIRAATQEQLKRVFVSVAAPKQDPSDDDLVVLAPFSIESYKGTHEPWSIMPHAIYPPGGRWGIMTTNESYSIAGGTDNFIERLLTGLPNDEETMLEGWLGHWATEQSRGARAVETWVPHQLTHVVGPTRTAELLQASRLRIPSD